MRRGVGLVWLVAACSAPAASPPAKPSASTTETVSSASPRVAEVHGKPVREVLIPLVDPPAVPFTAIPIDADDLRWPLARDPELSPHAQLATIYRTTAPWQELCRARGEPRGVDPATALAYLTAWCEMPQDRARARDRLADLASDPRASAIATAAREDLVDVIVESSLGATDAMRWLRARRMDAPPLLDALGATYAAHGMSRDALSLFEAANGVDPLVSTRCHRDLRMRELVTTPQSLYDPPSWHDATCRRVAMYLTCPLVARPWREEPCADCLHQIDAEIRFCPLEWFDDPYRRDELRLIALAKHWPRARGVTVWLAFAAAATKLVHVSHGGAIAVAALENAIRTSTCERSDLQNVAAMVNTLATNAMVDPPETLAAAKALAQLTPKTCNDLLDTLAKPH